MDAQPSQELRHLIQKVSGGAALTEDEIRTALDQMTEGAATPAQMGAFLMALRVRGETVEEITGAAQMMRARMNSVSVPDGAVDIVGTGGDGTGTFNVSTCAALLPPAPASRSPSTATVRSRRSSGRLRRARRARRQARRAVRDHLALRRTEAGVGFMWAPQHHPAMKHWAPIRGELGIRTIFNLLGPISNPAGVKRQVVGVFSWHWVEPIAHVLKNLGCEHVWVVHGHDGLDELTTTGATDVAEVKDGKVTVFEVTPADAGLQPAKLSDLKGGDAKYNAAAIRDVLAGKQDAAARHRRAECRRRPHRCRQGRQPHGRRRPGRARHRVRCRQAGPGAAGGDLRRVILRAYSPSPRANAGNSRPNALTGCGRAGSNAGGNEGGARVKPSGRPKLLDHAHIRAGQGGRREEETRPYSRRRRSRSRRFVLEPARRRRAAAQVVALGHVERRIPTATKWPPR